MAWGAALSKYCSIVWKTKFAFTNDKLGGGVQKCQDQPGDTLSPSKHLAVKNTASGIHEKQFNMHKAHYRIGMLLGRYRVEEQGKWHNAEKISWRKLWLN